MDLATSGGGGIGTFIGICVVSGLFGIADAHVQGGMIGDLSFMQPEFLQVSIFVYSSVSSSCDFCLMDLVLSVCGCFLFPSVIPCWSGSIRGFNLWFEVNYKSSISEFEGWSSQGS